MIADLKYFDGIAGARSTASRPSCAASTRPRSRSTRRWLVEAAARRQKWIDQAQSLNIYMAGASGKKLDETYKLAWLRGLKTTYYLRTLGATHAEKSTVEDRRAERGAGRRRHAAVRRRRAARSRAEVLLDRQPRMRGVPVADTASE